MSVMRNAIAVLAWTACVAQTPPPPADNEAESPIRANVTVVTAPTTVRNKSGEFLNDLQLGDFELYDNHELQKITADVQHEPVSLLVAVQRSANLSDVLPKIRRVGSMLNDLVAGEDGEVAVIGFDHGIYVEQDFTNQTQEITEALKKLKPGSSNHALVDVVRTSVRMLQRRPPDRRRILLLIAEKRDNGSTAKLREVLTEAQFANVTIFTLDISNMVAALTGHPMPQPSPAVPTIAQRVPDGGVLTPTTIDQQNYYMGNYAPMFIDIFDAAQTPFVDNVLEVFARFTGGRRYPVLSEHSLEGSIQGVGEELHCEYLFSYIPTNMNVGGFHEIRVVVNRPDLQVRTRSGYWIAGKPQ